jgi:hypothetical protein
MSKSAFPVYAEKRGDSALYRPLDIRDADGMRLFQARKRNMRGSTLRK